mmetsp:Transcript_7235/g.21157  ORF Transcript_7235/g.21157 Transcript_7235/m.21157 type:complete len:123 (-) Transcript_7235:103-471(-)
MLGAGLLVRTERVRATGLHQTYGDCYVEESSLWGQTRRHTFLCDDPRMFAQNADLYSFGCLAEGDRPGAGDSWYTLCGVAKDDRWASGLVEDVAMGFVLFLVVGCLRTVRTAPAAAEKLKDQ